MYVSKCKGKRDKDPVTSLVNVWQSGLLSRIWTSQSHKNRVVDVVLRLIAFWTSVLPFLFTFFYLLMESLVKDTVIRLNEICKNQQKKFKQTTNYKQQHCSKSLRGCVLSMICLFWSFFKERWGISILWNTICCLKCLSFATENLKHLMGNPFLP